MATYRTRIVDEILKLKLSSAAAVLVEGTKWCGKTTTCEQVSRSVIYMDDPSHEAQYAELSRIAPLKLLEGAQPRLIDEWQSAPTLWDAIRHKADRDKLIGAFVITGSAVPADIDKLKHSGTGRFAWLKMRPMSLWESGESSGAVSLSDLFKKGSFSVADARPLELEAVAEIVCRGGWPQSLDMSGVARFQAVRNILDAIVDRDASRVDGVSRDSDRVRRLLRSYARLQGTQATARVIKSDLQSNELMKFDDDTVYSYVNALKKLFVIEDVPAWCPNLRTKDAIRTSDTRYFVDPSLAAASLGAGTGELMNDLKTFGFFFETMVLRDLRVYAESLGGEVRHYHDKTGLECDAVIHLPNGEYGLFEVKLGGDRLIAEGVKTLGELLRLVREKGLKEPAFRMVVTAVGDYAYRRSDDGVVVCPVSALKP